MTPYSANQQELIIPVVLSGVGVSDTSIGVNTSMSGDMSRLRHHLAPHASAFLVGTTSEVHHLTRRQRDSVYHALLTHMPVVPVIAGILGPDESISESVEQAQGFGITRFALGLNHTGENQIRVQRTLEKLKNNNTLMLYHMPGGFKPAAVEDIHEWAVADERIIGAKDSSGDSGNYERLLKLQEGKPGFKLYCGSESEWKKLTDAQRKQSAGLISGTANVAPALLRKFMESPESVAVEYGELAGDLSITETPFDTGARAVGIQSYIHQMKKRLAKLGIFTGTNSSAMYSEIGTAFL